MKVFSLIMAAMVALSIIGSAAGAADTVLTVRVKQIGQADTVIEYSMADLEAMHQHALETTNDFVDGKQVFQGPRVKDLLIYLGAQDAKTARLTAANDYSVEIATEEFFRYDAILALTMGGERFSTRDKGPIWVMYPMSEHEELQDPVFNNRLIWQLVGMELE
ncbi:MAG: hypothetical protein GY947_04955 [Rhodobacteraceae bacterium]|nr:hypothetical protein [Paracoccaceae bacterium]